MGEDRGPDFFGLEKKLFEITDALETDIIKFVEPTNSSQQKKRFFEGLRNGLEVNPRFSYLPKNPIFAHFTITPDYARIKRELEGIEIENSGVGRLLRKKKKESLDRMEFIRSIGSSEFGEKSKKFYGKPAKKTVSMAFQLLSSLESKEDKKTLPSEKAAGLLGRELRQRKLGWKVVLDENISPNAVVLPGHKVLKLREHSFFSLADIKRLTKHEIETHIYRHLNGVRQPFRLFIEGADALWLKTEEGLAVVNESIFGLIEKEQLRTYAGRTIAVDFARRNSFYQTFKYLREFFPEEKAYQITQRVKRGMNDTSQPGAFTKDYFYFEGALEVQAFIENGGDPRKLYYGKISLADVEELESIPKLVKPKYLPVYPKNIAERARFLWSGEKLKFPPV